MIIERWFVTLLNMTAHKITKDTKQEFACLFGAFKHSIKIESVHADNVTISCNTYMLQSNGFFDAFGAPIYTHYDSMPSSAATTSRFYDYIMAFDNTIKFLQQQLQEHINQ